MSFHHTMTGFSNDFLLSELRRRMQIDEDVQIFNSNHVGNIIIFIINSMIISPVVNVSSLVLSSAFGRSLLSGLDPGF